MDIKPEPSSPAPAARDLDDEDTEVQIKDYKPSVDVSYKGAVSSFRCCFGLVWC